MNTVPSTAARRSERSQLSSNAKPILVEVVLSEGTYEHPVSKELVDGVRMPAGTMAKIGDHLQGPQKWIICSNQEVGCRLKDERKMLIRPSVMVEVPLQKISQIFK